MTTEISVMYGSEKVNRKVDHLIIIVLGALNLSSLNLPLSSSSTTILFQIANNVRDVGTSHYSWSLNPKLPLYNLSIYVVINLTYPRIEVLHVILSCLGNAQLRLIILKLSNMATWNNLSLVCGHILK